MSEKNTLYAKQAYLPQGWTENVRLHWDANGTLMQLETGVAQKAGEASAELVLPGITNLHSHAFQRAMAGLTEVAGDSKDSFWTWRELMYRYALQLRPDQLEAIAAQLYMECLRHGYTGVCEFHYLHRAPSGDWYNNPAEMSERLLAAADSAGIAITMLPVLYSYADFLEQPLREDQRRFRTDEDSILELITRLERFRSAQVEVGVAPHSLRATTTAQIGRVLAAMPADRPVHIHIAEQMREVDACIAAHGKRPVALLTGDQVIDSRWCLVHATHLDVSEVTAIAQSGAVAGICTTTEGNLGDGFFPLPEFLAQGGRFGVGSDSHVSQSPVEELRWLEYGQRLRLQGRNIAHSAEQKRVGDFLWQQALAGGAQASGRRTGQLQSGYQADIVVLDTEHPNLADLPVQQALNTWLLAGNDNLVRDVYAGGHKVVSEGRHVRQEAIQRNYRDCMRALRTA